MDRFVQSNHQLHLEPDHVNGRSPQVIGFETINRNDVMLCINPDLTSQYSDRVYLRINEVRKFRRILDSWLTAQGEPLL